MQRRMLVRGIWHRQIQWGQFQCRVVSHREVFDYGVTHHIRTRTGPPVDVRVQQGSGGCSISANVYICVRVGLMCVFVSVDGGTRGGGDDGVRPARLRRM